MRGKSLGSTRWALLVLAGAALFSDSAAQGQQGPVFEMDFMNAQLVPAHWVLTLGPDGNGNFDAEGGHPADPEATHLWVGDVHRPIQVSAAFAQHVFETARARRLFVFPCESHMKVAFQGLKRLSYRGPDGSGACEFNYSKDKEIEELGNSLLAVEYTILSGARMEMLMQHDRLGLDQELDNLAAAAKEGNAAEMGTIRETLTRVASDESVMDRARRKARFLLTQAH